MSNLDNRLLSLLRMNARMSVSDLARALQVSRTTVQTRLKQLESNKVIAGYTIQYGSDYRKQLISAQVLIKATQKLTDKICASLKQFPQVSALYVISGDYDLIAVITVASIEEMNTFLDRVAGLAGTERITSCVILETKFVR